MTVVPRRRVEDCMIDMVDWQVCDKEEELVWRDREDLDAVRNELVVAPVTSRLARSCQLSHGRVGI